MAEGHFQRFRAERPLRPLAARPDVFHHHPTATARVPGVIVMNARGDMAKASKISMRRTMESSRIIDEKEVTYHGMAGWQIETKGIIRGHDTCFVQWLYTTNGFGYQLSAWAPTSAKGQLEVEAIRLFEGFELTPPQRLTATPNAQ